MHRPGLRHFLAALPVLAAGALAGCGSEAALVAGLVSGMLSPQQPSGVGDTPEQPYATGERFREAALAAADQAGSGISSICRAHLPAAEPDAAPELRCAVRALCLPGASEPVRMMTCRHDPPT